MPSKVETYTLTSDGHGKLELMTIGMTFLYTLLLMTEPLHTKDLFSIFPLCFTVLVLYSTGDLPEYGTMFSWLFAQGAVFIEEIL
jgi:hypothetical protein